MGSGSSREPRPSASPGHPTSHGDNPRSSHRAVQSASTERIPSSRSIRNSNSRPDLSFLGINAGADRDHADFTRRETRAERDVRKREKERLLREHERERSMRKESVDGGFLVTLGTYTGPEDFSKPTVRRLMIERRVAPFWKGLNDHADTWTEAQLVCVVAGRPLPAPDEPLPPDLERVRPPDSKTPKPLQQSLNSLAAPVDVKSQSSSTSDVSGRLSPSHDTFSLPSVTSPFGNTISASPFFRGRSKTTGLLTTSSNNDHQLDIAPQEVMLPNNDYVNGQRFEAFLYKDASECPICFLYYPPYLNMTRCCDQPICSECFVQIKRADPHPPEHHDPSDLHAPPSSTGPQDDYLLVSEPAACPFCKQPDFGVTYDPPPFRNGLVYQGQVVQPSATSSSSSLTSPISTDSGGGGRKRGRSLSANSPHVITTDAVRPDWVKKLADARAHALRRSAAATALHNAAYVIGNTVSDGRGFSLGRRRRNPLHIESRDISGAGTPRTASADALAHLLGSSSRSHGGQTREHALERQGSRASRAEDLEELMMMEAIRLSLAVEEERKRKEEKETEKRIKKEEKKKAKEDKNSQRHSCRNTTVVPSSSHPGQSSQARPIAPDNAKTNAIGQSRTDSYQMSASTVMPKAGASSSVCLDAQTHLEEPRPPTKRLSNLVHSAPPSEVNATTSDPMTMPQPSDANLSALSSQCTESAVIDPLPHNSPRLHSTPDSSRGLSTADCPSAFEINFGADAPPGSCTDPAFHLNSPAAPVDTNEQREKSPSDYGDEFGQSNPSLEASRITSEEGMSTAPSSIPAPNAAVLYLSDAVGTSADTSHQCCGECSSSSVPPPVLVTPASPPPGAKLSTLPTVDVAGDDLDEGPAEYIS